jgi:hypothetical protein
MRAAGASRNPLPAQRLLRVIGVAAALAAQGCGGPEPLALRVSAASPGALAEWREQARAQMGPRLARDFDEALGEMRLRTLARGLSEAAADGAVTAQVNGSDIRHVLLDGFALRLGRLEFERSVLEKSLGRADLRGPMAGDHAPAAHLADLHARQRARLAALALEMDGARQRLKTASIQEGQDDGGRAGHAAPVPAPTPAAGARD